MLKNPLISVVIPNYNYGHLIHDNLSGLSSQTYKNWEAIIVDDGSQDNSREIIASFAETDSRFKPIYLNENNGVQLAIRRGLESIAGELFCFSSSDDFICNNSYFQSAISEFRDKQNLGAVFFKSRIINSEDNHYMCDLGYSPRKYLSGPEAARFYFHRIFLMPGSSTILPVKLLKMIGNHEDLGPQHDHFLIHAAAAVGGCAFINEVGAVMRYSPKTYGADTDFIANLERHARLEKYFKNLFKLLNYRVDKEIFINWRESIINDEKGRIGDFDQLALHIDRFFSNLTIEHFTLFKQIIIDFKPKLDEFSKNVTNEVVEQRKIAHGIFESIAGKIE